MDVFCNIEYFINGCTVMNHLSYAQICFDGDLVHALICRRGSCANSKRTEDLSRIAMVMGAYFGNEYVAFFKKAIRLLLCRYAYRWILHRRGSHIVNMVFTTQTQV